MSQPKSSQSNQLNPAASEVLEAGLVAGRQFFAAVTAPTALEQVLLRFKRPVFASW